VDTAKKEMLLRELEEARERLIAQVISRMDALRDRILSGEEVDVSDVGYETLWPLSTMPEMFKGRKPTAILFDEERVPVKKWREVYTLVLKRCAADEAGHAALMYLRNKIHGRSRTFLSDKPDGMDFPIKVCDGLYAEADFDTGALIRMLTTGILAPARYDYSGIAVALKGNG
jgi:hypothetical protein